MATNTILFASIPFFLLFLLSTPTEAQPTAPAPGPAGPINVTAILEKGGQFAAFIRLLSTTQAGNQIDNQLNNSNQGLTVFAPTDNAFNNLPSGALNGLNPQEQVQLVQYHILPKYYSLDDLLSVSNPVRTQAPGQDGGNFGLNFTGQGNQVNVSTGIVETQVNNFLREQFPLAVYSVDKVLLPQELFGVKAPAAAPPPKSAGSSGTADKTTDNKPAPSGNAAAGGNKAGFGLALGLAFFCLRLLS